MLATDSGRGDAAVELLSILYPAPLTVEIAPGRLRASRATWIGIPSANSPRLLVPAGAPRAAIRMTRRQLTGRRARTRAARAGLSMAMGTGLLPRIPRLRLAVTGPRSAPSIEDPLRDVLCVDDVRLTLPIGPPRANRKPVLQVTDPHGHVLAFAKIGHNELTRRLVRHEGEALDRVHGAMLHAVRAPRVIASLSWAAQVEVLVLEGLDIPAKRETGESGRRCLLAIVREIAAVGGVRAVAWRNSPHRTWLLSEVERCGPLAGVLRRHVESFEPELSLPTGAWHGDLNPGNVALVADSGLVWDWERFATGVPVGFDLLHHDLHQLITVDGLPARDAASRLFAGAADALAPLDVDRAIAGSIARMYLITLACRYVGDRQLDAGGDLGRVAEWLLPALEACPLEGGSR